MGVAVTTMASAMAQDAVHAEAKGKDAVPIGRTPPRYPARAAEKGIEGWVLVSFVIKIDGSVGEVSVIDSQPSGVFEKAAVRSVNQWTYRPATQKGIPVTQSNTQVVLTFELEDRQRGATRGFVRNFKSAQTALAEMDIEKAKQIIEEIEKQGTKSHYEHAYFNILKANYNIKTKEYQRAVQFLRKATIGGGPHIEKKRRIIYMRTLFELEAYVRDYWAALQTYHKIIELKPLRSDDPIHEPARKVKAILDGDSPLPKSGTLKNRCPKCKGSQPMWVHNLYRRKFYIDQIEGSISAFKLYCDYHWADIEFNPELSYSVSGKWGQCDIYVYGEDGTTFRLVEQ